MKKHALILMLLLAVLSSCEGSDTYQGKWKAMDSQGVKFDITFTPTDFIVKDSTGKSNKYSYTQNSIKTENSVETYGITLEDGRGYQLYFPQKDESIGLVLDENGERMFTICRSKYLPYEDIYKLN